MNFFEPLIDLLLPSNCAECDKPPSVYCFECLGRRLGQVHEVQRQHLSGVSLTDLDQGMSKALSAFKEKNQFAVARLLIDNLLPSDFRPNAELVVAAPSKANSFAKRGFVPADLVAERVAKRLNLRHLPRALRITGQVKDQASLTETQRKENLVGSMRGVLALRGRRVLLVDDIVTTGSTLIEVERAVTAAGGQCVGFLTIAETARKYEAKVKNLLV